MAALGCSQWEIATILGIGERTLRERLHHDPEIKRNYELGQVEQFLKLRRLQWRHASGPNGTSMTIHLSKHLLGQHDKSLIMNLSVEDIDLLLQEMERAQSKLEGSQDRANGSELLEAEATSPTDPRTRTE